MRKYFEPLIYSIVAALAALSLKFKLPLSDSDVFWSMAIGQWITLHKAFPVVDSFSWTINGKEWLTHEWLYCYGAHHLYALWGNLGLYALSFLPMVITIYFLYKMNQKSDLNKSYAFLLTLTIGILLLYKLCIPFRAYIYALLFFTMLIYLMYFRKESKFDVIYYGILFMLWANFHVSVCMGFVILFVEIMRRVVVSQRYKQLGIVLTSAAVTLINPYGFMIWDYFLFTLTSMGESRAIAEWQAPRFDNVNLLAAYLVLAGSVILWQFYYKKQGSIETQGQNGATSRIFEQPNTKTKGIFIRAWEYFRVFAQNNFTSNMCLLVLFWAFYVYSLYSIRMIFYTIVLWIIVAGAYIGRNRKLDFTMRTYWIFTILFLAFFIGSYSKSNPNAKNIFDYDYRISPVQEVQFLLENPTYQYHLFNNYLFGGYLILNDIPVFIDARSDSYIKFGVFDEYRRITLLNEDPQLLLDEISVHNVIEMKDSPLNWYLSVNPRWSLIYEGPNACIYTRINQI